MTFTDPTVVRISNPADLLAILPYLLGYQPISSLVVVAIDNNSRLLLGARIDLAATEDELRKMAVALREVAATMTAHGASRVVLAGYGTAKQVHPSIRAATATLVSVGLPVRDALRVEAGRYFSLTCPDPACCPPEGTPFDPTTSAAAAAAVTAGLVALPDREAVEANLAPVTGPARDRMAEATTKATQSLLELIATASDKTGQCLAISPNTSAGRALLDQGRRQLAEVEQHYQDRQPVNDEQAALLTILVSVQSVRAFAARQATGKEWQVDMWADLVRRAQPDFVAASATLLVLCALQAGNGTLAEVAVRRALEADPTDRLARVLADVVAAGIDPATVTALLAS